MRVRAILVLLGGFGAAALAYSALRKPAASEAPGKPGAPTAVASAFRITPLAALANPDSFQPGNFKLEQAAPGVLKVTPAKGEKSVRLQLKEPIPINDDSAWFSLPYYPISSGYVTERNPLGYRATLQLSTAKGPLDSKTFAYRRDHKAKRGWQNLISEWTLLRYPESLRKGMQITALEFSADPNMESLYFATPQLYGGDIMNPRLASASGVYGNTWYGQMAPIYPFYHRDGAYECSLAVRNAYQAEPIYETTRSFDFGADNGPDFNPLKALDGFVLPEMPEGVYLCTLTFRDTDGRLLQREKVEYHVLASSVTSLPVFENHAKGTGNALTFQPAKKDFIFGADEKITGDVVVANLSSRGWKLADDQRRVRYSLTNFHPNKLSTINEPAVAQGELAVDTGGGAVPLSLAVPAEFGDTNRAFVLGLDLLVGDKKVDRAEFIVGVRGKADERVIPPGRIETWQEMFQRPILGEGPHPLLYMPKEDLEEFLSRIQKEGVSEFVDVDCMWSEATEPLPGFYTFGYIDRFLDALRRHNLRAIMHTTGIAPAPEWSLFENEPEKLQDGRFLRGDTWEGISAFAKNPTSNIRDLVTELGNRYTKDPTVGMWTFWGMRGEGVFSDWALSWRYGGGKTGYGKAGMAAYRKFIERKYKTIQALNEAYGTAYADWQEVAPPLPPAGFGPGHVKRHDQPVVSRAYEDFLAMKSDFHQEYFERFLAGDFRKIDPLRPLTLYYYADVETGYERPTLAFFKNNPGIIQRNGGNEIAGTWNKQYMYFRAYEDTPTMSEDNAVYADTDREWASNFFNSLQIGKWGGEFLQLFLPRL